MLQVYNEKSFVPAPSFQKTVPNQEFVLCSTLYVCYKWQTVQKYKACLPFSEILQSVWGRHVFMWWAFYRTVLLTALQHYFNANRETENQQSQITAKGFMGGWWQFKFNLFMSEWTNHAFLYLINRIKRWSYMQ